MADREAFIQSAATAIAAALRQGVPDADRKRALAIADDACEQAEILWDRYSARRKARRANE